jgi:outer membrane receptor for ferrienterochelin and colicins
LILRISLACFTTFFSSSASFAHEHEEAKEGEHSHPVVLERISVHAHSDERVSRDEVIKTERVTRRRIEQKSAQTLADALRGEPGIDALTSCANCGSKRLTVNGLRGEQTTVLIDGVPLHSTVSGFYGLDAIPTVGIEAIEISRGSGASLTAPEAIGGVVNVITKKATENSVRLDASGGWGDPSSLPRRLHTFSGVGTAVTADGRHGLVLAGQLSAQQRWDEDRNGVSESPDLENRSVFLKTNHAFGKATDLELRAGWMDLDIRGGTTNGTRLSSTVQGPFIDPPLFESWDTQRVYLDRQDRVTDTVGLKRAEAFARLSHRLTDDLQLVSTTAYARQRQDAVYFHGYDYANDDRIAYQQLKASGVAGDSHFWNFAVEAKLHSMRSRSVKLYDQDGLPKDDFRFLSKSVALQDVWRISDSVELSSALRADSLQVDFKSSSPAGGGKNEIDEWLLSPRAHLKWIHSPEWTSRFSYGRGYRPPLSFFESEHGLNEHGFVTQIDRVEKSHSFGYALNRVTGRVNATLSSHYTLVQNQAYADQDVSGGSPAVFRNSGETLGVWANDLVVNWIATRDLSVQAGYERFAYPDRYKELLPVAAIEQRVTLIADYHVGKWELISTLTWIGARNLTKYGYGDHYRTVAMEEDPDVPGDFRLVVADKKGQRAPAFATLDLYAGYEASKKMTAFFSVQNIFDYTQTGAGDSPLNWSTHNDDRDHFHLDNNHLWGPTRGRTFIAGVRIEL